MIKVLHILNNLGSGGAEMFVMNVYRNIDRSKVQFDFLIRSRQNGAMINEIEAMGGKVIISPSVPKHLFKNIKFLKSFLKSYASDYSAIHIHLNSLTYIYPLIYAKKYNIPIRILHSHNSKSNGSIYTIVHLINRIFITKYATNLVACSDLAGKWMFGTKKYNIIPNGIDLNKYLFDKVKRESIRKHYNIDNKIVLGNVGRFTKQKNHIFLLEIFKIYHYKENNSVLLLIGDGEEKGKIYKKVQEMGLEQSVIFTGSVDNVENYLSALDLFLFPSLWEGFPITLIEAQVNGLPIICSSEITETIKINSNLKMLNIDLADAWINEMLLGFNRIEGLSESLKKYDEKNTMSILMKIYNVDHNGDSV